MAKSDFLNPAKFSAVMKIIDDFKKKNKAEIDKGQPANLKEMLNLGIDLVSYCGEYMDWNPDTVYWPYHSFHLVLKLIWPNFNYKPRFVTLQDVKGIGIFVDYTFDGKTWIEGTQYGTPMEGKSQTTPTDTTARDVVDAIGRTFVKEISMRTGLGYNYWTDADGVKMVLGAPNKKGIPVTTTAIGSNGAMLKETKATVKPKATKKVDVAPAIPQQPMVQPQNNLPNIPPSYVVGNGAGIPDNDVFPQAPQVPQQTFTQPTQPAVQPQPYAQPQLNQGVVADSLYLTKLLDTTQKNPQVHQLVSTYLQEKNVTNLHDVPVSEWVALLSRYNIHL